MNAQTPPKKAVLNCMYEHCIGGKVYHLPKKIETEDLLCNVCKVEPARVQAVTDARINGLIVRL